LEVHPALPRVGGKEKLTRLKSPHKKKFIKLKYQLKSHGFFKKKKYFIKMKKKYLKFLLNPNIDKIMMNLCKVRLDQYHVKLIERDSRQLESKSS